MASINRDIGTVFLGNKNVAMLVAGGGWAKVREQGQQKREVSPYLAELLRLEEQAKQKGLGRWSKAPGAAEASIRNLPLSAIGDPSNLDAMGLLAENKGRPMEGIVEQVRDGSTFRVYLLPRFQFVQIFVVGIQSPEMGRRAALEAAIETELTADDTNEDVPGEPRAPLTSAQRLAVSAFAAETAADPFAHDAKFFTEMRVLNRHVRIVLEGKVVEVVSEDCVIVADDSIPYGSPLPERRVNLSSIRCPNIGNPRRYEKLAPYAREAKEFLRTRLIGRQVTVQMEYSRKVGPADGSTVPSGPADSRVMDFGTVFLVPPVKVEVVGRGFGTVIRHRDFEERSNYYDALLAAESRAISGRKGIHYAKDPPVMHITDLTIASAKKAKDFLPFLH
ncbi:ribonuclease TUDOR 1-like [Senna tora]|uniref:Ribonuclease TUDOR 1-like n=1 Tax=Senna tora TaxID=362788 RepID=A0A834WX89_9FABA|nr:ribonuclease TUDOR 1-like [Senna tora]